MAATEIEMCARRGGHWLSELELEAHLASLLRLDNVGVFLGAGASVGHLGGKTMQALWEEYQADFSPIVAWMVEENFVTDTSNVNVETVLDSLEVARIEARRRGETNGMLDLALHSLQRAVITAALLKQEWWDNPGNICLARSELDTHRRLLLKLVSTRMPGQPAPWLFTTNYDLAIEWAAETLGLYITNGFSGLHRRTFSSHNFDLGFRNVLARGEARFGTYNVYLSKLHGSLSWYLENGQLLEGSCGHLWPNLHAFLEAERDDGPGVIVYPSGAKHLETASFELGELVRRFSEFVARPQSGLIVSGYSFSDQHLNRILLGSLQNPTFQLVIYFPAAEREGEELLLTDDSSFVNRMARLESPQVTIVGGGDQAYFDRFVTQIPDPVVYDEQAAQIREILRELTASSKTTSYAGPAPSSSPGAEDDEDIPF